MPREHASFLPLRGDNLHLRLFRESDVIPRYTAWLNDPEVVRFSNQRFRRHTEESGKVHLRSFKGTDNLFLAICLNDGGQTIGTMTAYVSRPHGTADMGILLGEKGVWGQSFGLESWRLLMARLLEEGTRKVTAGTLRCNLGTVRIMEWSGMELEAVRFGHELVEGHPQDILYFARFNRTGP